MPLSATKLRNAKPADKQYKLRDEKGLYIIVTPKGGYWWRLDYRLGGKRKTISLGTYPDVTLQRARQRRDEARSLIAEGVDPSAERKAHRTRATAAGKNTFEAVTREWHATRKATWSKDHAERVMGRLEAHIFPWIGNRPVSEVEAPALLSALRRIEHNGTVETAHRALQSCSQAFRYAIATGRATRDPAADLRGALQPYRRQHHATITEPAKIGALLRAIDGYDGQYITKCALRFAPLVFVRPGELRKAEWPEIDLGACEWRIPAEKMKMRAPHIVPLSQQAVAILRELEPLTGRGKYVFPSLRSAQRPMSENTVNAALRRLGYGKDEMTGHGFRSMASTILNEQQAWHRDAIERQLAHAPRDDVRAAYNYAEHLPERRRMMQAWADYLDGLKSDKVVAFHKVPDSAGQGDQNGRPGW